VRRTALPGLLALLTIAALVAVALVVGARLVVDRDLARGGQDGSVPAPEDLRPDGVPGDAGPAELAGVVDGDTIRILDPAGNEQRVRLLNIDAPEHDHPDHGRECGARTATDLVEDLLPPGTTVWLAGDREDRDRFDRLLRYAWTADGTDVQAALVDAGLAEVIVVPPNDRFAGGLRPLEAAARDAAIGMWGADCLP
jgi:micrococcal nuclease